MIARSRAADVMNRADPAYRTLFAEVEKVRREARRRFGSFVLDQVNPGSHFRNKECQPHDNRIFERAGDIGLMRFSLPAEIGGEGRDKLAWGVVVEEIARLSRDPGFAVLLDITVEICELILSSGKPELIERYVPDMMAGRRFGVQGAYENRDPYDYQSTARLDGDEWVLSGAKRFLAAARFADLFVLFLRDEASNDMLAFLVEKDDPGVTRVHMDTMGMHTLGLGQVVLHQVRLPQWRLMWRADALSELNTYARIRRTMSACGVLGALEGVIDNCVETLSSRRRSGRRVLDYPNVERSVGEMRALLQQARGSIYRALDGTRSPDRDPYFDEYATVAKHHASECALRVGHLVMGLLGGEAYMSAFPWERFMRDILGLISGQGSQEMLLIQLGQRAIVGIEGKRVREEAAERALAKLTDSWWALHAAESAALAESAGAAEGGPSGSNATRDGSDAQLPQAVREVVSAAKLDPLTPDQRRDVTELLDRAHALVTTVRSGQAPDALPHGPDGLFDGRLATVARDAWSLLACAVAQETGLLPRLFEPCTVKEAAGDLPEDLTASLLGVLTVASVVRVDGDGRYYADKGLERVLIGGPRTSAFAARLRRAVASAARLRNRQSSGGSELSAGRALVAGCGAESAPLVDELVNSLLGRLEGLPEALDRPGAKVGCIAGDGGRSAVELARHIPLVPVLALEPEPVDVSVALGSVEFRTDYADEGRLALAWLPAAGRPLADLERAITSAASSLIRGGWIVLPCPLPPKRPLGAAASRLDLALAGGPLPAAGEVEDLLKSAGLGHVRTAWEDTALGIRLLAARRP
jgi:alkylation response protein AidB-like acyl-CoA dehydrogenase